MQAGIVVPTRAGSGVVAAANDAVATANAGLFAGSLAQNAGVNGRVRLAEAVAAGRVCQAYIRSIQITSADQLDWEFWFWRNKKFQQGPDATQESFAGYVAFTGSTAGRRIAGAGLYYYAVDNLAVPYYDADGEGFLNVTLINRSAGGKTAGAWFDVTFGLEPTGA